MAVSELPVHPVSACDLRLTSCPTAVLYAFSIAYLAGPVVGIPVDSAHIVELAQTLPEWLKLSGKTLLAAPFAFHALNGVRHLAWDSVKRKSIPFIFVSACLIPMSILQ